MLSVRMYLLLIQQTVKPYFFYKKKTGNNTGYIYLTFLFYAHTDTHTQRARQRARQRERGRDKKSCFLHFRGQYIDLIHSIVITIISKFLEDLTYTG